MEEIKRDGFSIYTAIFFIMGELAGGGLLTLPYAISLSTWYGIPIIFIAAICGAVTGYYLGKSWLILEYRYPEKYCNRLTRKPYATIGLHSYGKYMSIIVSIILNVTNTSATVVFFLFTSDLITKLLHKYLTINICQLIPIISIIFLMPLLFGTPIDFWPIAYLATFSTSIGTIILIISLILQIFNNKNNNNHNEYHVKNFENFSSCFGIIFAAFGGAAIFPTFQNDMKNKKQFSTAVMFAFMGLLLLYLPVAIFGYISFGINSQSNVLNNFSSNELIDILITIIRICFLLHFSSVILMTINPVFLDLEELLNIPKNFTWKRFLFRTFMLIIITFIGETFPNFGKILELIGGSTVTITSFILPPIFYLKLSKDFINSNDHKNDEKIINEFKCTIKIKFLLYIIIVISSLGGIASTYSTLKNWQPLESACYMNKNNFKFIK